MTHPLGPIGAAGLSADREAAALGAAARRAGAGESAGVEDMLSRAAAGDESAWREIVERYARRVFALARSRRLREHVAEEVTQSVFATVAAHVRTGEYVERGRFESWLFRVAMNRVRDEVRRNKRRAGEMGSAGLEGRADGREAPVSAPDGAAEELTGLRRAMETLGDADRDVLELRHHAGMGFKEIAALLGEPLGTVLARHHRALAKLRDMLITADKERAS